MPPVHAVGIGRPQRSTGGIDLALALDRMAGNVPRLVTLAMHHALKRGSGVRQNLMRHRHGTALINAACVPRSGIDEQGRPLLHFSWAEFQGSRLTQLSHRWYTPDAELIHQEQLPMDAP